MKSNQSGSFCLFVPCPVPNAALLSFYRFILFCNLIVKMLNLHRVLLQNKIALNFLININSEITFECQKSLVKNIKFCENEWFMVSIFTSSRMFIFTAFSIRVTIEHPYLSCSQSFPSILCIFFKIIAKAFNFLLCGVQILWLNRSEVDIVCFLRYLIWYTMHGS